MSFSEENKFVMKNWGIIQKLKIAEGEFETKLANYLLELKNILSQEKWWNNDIIFMKNGDEEEVYISKNSWKIKENFVIWIGVEDFYADNLFGIDDNAYCYLWVSEKDNEKAIKIVNQLTGIFDKHKEFSDYISKRKRYILEKPLKKYEPDEIDSFINGDTLKEIAAFFGEVYLKIKDYKI